MAGSIRVTKVGTKQIYNLRDAEDVHRAQKAINERINQIAKTYGEDSQIYRDYIAPIVNGAMSGHIRFNAGGIVQLKTGKGENTAVTRDAIERMLVKATAGDIAKRTAEQLGGVLTLKESRATGRPVVSRADVIALAERLHNMELNIYSRLDEIYELENKKEAAQTKLNTNDWYKKLKDSHGKPSTELIKEIDAFLQSTTNQEILQTPTRF